jgi:5-amino-6-(5-phosphoribosylamino)uracil reductase
MMPHTTLVLASTVDGKIADVGRSPAKFGSQNDYRHLEERVAAADAVVAGAGTLRSGGTAMRVMSADLLADRQRQGLPLQPIQIVASLSGDIPRNLGFFRQDVPRWLLTNNAGSQRWQGTTDFNRIIIAEATDGSLDWRQAWEILGGLGVNKIAALGGGEVTAALFAAESIDEIHLTICPLIYGGAMAPTPVEGCGFTPDNAPRLKLLSYREIAGEIFLHYRVLKEV